MPDKSNTKHAKTLYRRHRAHFSFIAEAIKQLTIKRIKCTIMGGTRITSTPPERNAIAMRVFGLSGIEEKI